MRAAFDGWHGLMLLTPRKLPMPDAGGRTSSVKTWLRLYTDAKLDIYIFILQILFLYKFVSNDKRKLFFVKTVNHRLRRLSSINVKKNFAVQTIDE